MGTYFCCDGKKWQAPSIAPQNLATTTPENFAQLFFALPVNKKELWPREIRQLLTQCFTSLLDNRHENGIQSVGISRGYVMKRWKDDGFWQSRRLASFANTLPSAPSGPASQRRNVVKQAPVLPSRGVSTLDVSSSGQLRGSDATMDRYLPSPKDRRLENRRVASPRGRRAEDPRDRRSGRLEDRVEDPRRRMPPATPTAEKRPGSGNDESASLKRVKVEHRRSPPLSTRPGPLTIKPPARQTPLAQNPGSEPRAVANGQPYSPTTPHLNVTWPISKSPKLTENPAGEESGISEPPALPMTGCDAQFSGQGLGASLKKLEEYLAVAYPAEHTEQLAARGVEKPTEHGPHLGVTNSQGTSQNKPPSLVATAGTNSLPSPSETPHTPANRPFPGSFQPDGPPATNGTYANPHSSAASVLPNGTIHGKAPVANSQKLRQSQSQTMNTHMILLETLLRGAVRELASTDEPASAYKIRVETLLQGAVAELENLKGSLEGV